jgi:aerobic C4-dicarboxylate transport protein
MATVITQTATRCCTAARKPFYRSLWGQVLLGVAIAIVLGYVAPTTAQAMRPLGDAFIRLITMVISLVIFCTVAAGIAGMDSIKKVGRVGGKALLYFEVLTSIALIIGLVVGALIQPGAGFNATPTRAMRPPCRLRRSGEGADGDRLPPEHHSELRDRSVRRRQHPERHPRVVLVGFALASLGSKAKPVPTCSKADADGLRRRQHPDAPGADRCVRRDGVHRRRYGLSSLGPLAKLIVTLWITSALFVLIVLGAVAAIAGFSIIRFLKYIREEIVLTLSLSSSTRAAVADAEARESGCSKALVGLVTPTGYIFNPDGSCIYMALAAVFVAQATDVPLTLRQLRHVVRRRVSDAQGRSGVQGAAFIALVATLMVIPSIPVGGMAIILGLDRFMSMCRATTNMLCNGVATARRVALGRRA